MSSKVNQFLEKWSHRIAAALFTLFGAGGAYLLGVFAVVPKPIWSLIDEHTILFLTSDVLITLTISWALFKLARIPVEAIYSFGVFLYCKIIVGPKYERGLRHPKVARFETSTLRRFLRGREGRTRAILAQAIISVYFTTTILFSSVDLADISLFPLVVFGTFYFLISTLFAYRVAMSQSLSDFIASREGVRLLSALALMLVFIAGSVRTSSMMNESPMTLQSGDLVCEVSAMFPVSGGDLFFVPQGYIYLVLRYDGSRLFFRKSQPATGNIQCDFSQAS